MTGGTRTLIQHPAVAPSDTPVSTRFADADHASSALRPMARITLMERGDFCAELTRCWFDDMMLQHADIGQPLHAVVAMPLAWVIGFGPAARASEHWNGEMLQPDQLVLHRPGREAHLVSKGGEWGSLTVSQASLERIFEERAGRPPPPATRQMLRPAPLVMAGLRSLYQVAALQPQGAAGEAGRMAMRDTLEGLLVACLSGTPIGPEDSFAAGRGQLLAALDEICQASADEMLTVSRVCRQLRTDERMLKLLCQHVFGTSLNSHLTQWRLRHVRVALLRAAPDETTIASEAMRQGFWELGRFAAAYRRAWGENPSETLRRVR